MMITRYSCALVFIFSSLYGASGAPFLINKVRVHINTLDVQMVSPDGTVTIEKLHDGKLHKGFRSTMPLGGFIPYGELKINSKFIACLDAVCLALTTPIRSYAEQCVRNNYRGGLRVRNFAFADFKVEDAQWTIVAEDEMVKGTYYCHKVFVITLPSFTVTVNAEKTSCKK